LRFCAISFQWALLIQGKTRETPFCSRLDVLLKSSPIPQPVDAVSSVCPIENIGNSDYARDGFGLKKALAPQVSVVFE
jgi:hypothetical protein